MGSLLIIRGAPGVGKSAVGKLFSENFKNGVTIEIDEIRRMINAISWISTKEHLDAIGAARSLLLSYWESNYDPVTIIDTLSQGTINIILGNIPKEIDYKIISLYADEAVIKDRILARNSGFMDYDLSFKVNTSIMQEKLDYNYLVNTSDLSVREVFNKVIELLQR